MIVSPRPGGLLLVRQVDHQDQCGLMADAWGNERFGRRSPTGRSRSPPGSTTRAGALGAGPGGRARRGPVNFSAIDRPTHVALYREGIAAAAARDPRAGLLVSLHGQGLYEGRRGLDPGPATPRAEREPEVQAFLAEQDDVQEALRARIGAAPGARGVGVGGYRLLQTWDVMSLFLTWATLWDRGRLTLPQVPRAAPATPASSSRWRPAAGAVVCDPWPFAEGAVELPVEARTVPDRRYASSAGDLAAELSRAAWVTREFRLRPA